MLTESRFRTNVWHSHIQQAHSTNLMTFLHNLNEQLNLLQIAVTKTINSRTVVPHLCGVRKTSMDQRSNDSLIDSTRCFVTTFNESPADATHVVQSQRLHGTPSHSTKLIGDPRMMPYQFLLVATAFLLLLLVDPSTAFSSASKNMAAPFCLNVKVQVRPDQRDQFLECIKLDQKDSLETEPACLQFVVGEDTSTPNTFYFHEEYVDEDGFQYHTKTPHFAKWKALL